MKWFPWIRNLTATEIQSLGDESEHEQPKAPPNEAVKDAPPNLETLHKTLREFETRFKQGTLDNRQKLLDDRAKTINTWLAATAIFLTFFSAVVVIIGYITYENVREIEKETREHVERIQEIGEKLESIRENPERTTFETSSEAPAGNSETTENVQKAPAGTSMGRDVTAPLQGKEFLDDQAGVLGWWLVAMVISFALLAVIVGVIFKRIREFEDAARKSLKLPGKYADDTQKFVEKTRESSEKKEKIRKKPEGINTEIASKYPVKASEASEDVRQNPAAPLMDRAVAAAISLQGQGRIEEATRKWQSIADIAEGSNKELGARAWFSVGYLRRGKSDFEGAVNAYDKAIELKPDLVGAYNNRGNAKGALGRHEAALADYDEAIRLKPNYAKAYNNRGNAKYAVGRHKPLLPTMTR